MKHTLTIHLSFTNCTCILCSIYLPDSNKSCKNTHSFTICACLSICLCPLMTRAALNWLSLNMCILNMKISITLSDISNTMWGFEFELRVSKLLRWEQLLYENEILTQTEVRKHLGSPIAAISFNSLDDKAKEWKEITFFLIRPENRLWVLLNDLAAKVLLTKPTTITDIQTLKHKDMMGKEQRKTFTLALLVQ